MYIYVCWYRYPSCIGIKYSILYIYNRLLRFDVVLHIYGVCTYYPIVQGTRVTKQRDASGRDRLYKHTTSCRSIYIHVRTRYIGVAQLIYVQLQAYLSRSSTESENLRPEMRYFDIQSPLAILRMYMYAIQPLPTIRRKGGRDEGYTVSVSSYIYT